MLSVKQVELAKQKISSRNLEREYELTTQYGQLRNIERNAATSEERQRIMQEMHDGVGSQLLTTLMMAQRGISTQNDITLSIQECLDDMRLAIDALTPEDPDVLPILGNFRFRMESRFKGLGIALNWRNHCMPESFDLPPYVGLQLLRIIQEILANAIKHSNATIVDANIHYSMDRILINIQDNGKGFNTNDKNFGKGLVNMRVRAKKIRAVIKIESSSSGTPTQIDLRANQNIVTF